MTNAGPASEAALLLTRSELSKAQRPEWLRVPEAQRIFGLGRTYIYDLISSNSVKSFALRKKHGLRGIRLISYESLAEFCENAAEAAGAK